MNFLLVPIHTDLTGLQVLLTAGPTQEALDPVRYILNHSTGRMEYALAQVMAERGAHVTLVSGLTSQTATHPAITVVQVRSAAELYAACLTYFPSAKLTVMAAAVADYTPNVVAIRKLKKKENEFTLELVKTVGIAASLGNRKRNDQLPVGFALENAGAAFGHDTNQVMLIHRDGAIHRFALTSKRAVAADIVDQFISVVKVSKVIQTNQLYANSSSTIL